MKKLMIVLMLVVFVASFATAAFAKGKPVTGDCFYFLCLCEFAPKGTLNCHWKICCEYPDGTHTCYLDKSKPCIP